MSRDFALECSEVFPSKGWENERENYEGSKIIFVWKKRGFQDKIIYYGKLFSKKNFVFLDLKKFLTNGPVSNYVLA